MSSPSPPPSSKRAKVGVRYQETRRKALELFAEHGFSRVGMRDIAAHLGIAPGSLYNHIESKETVLFEFIEELYWHLLKNADRVNRRGTEGTVRLRGLLDAHLSLHETMPLHFRLAEFEMHCLTSEQHERIIELRERYLKHWIQAVTLRCDRAPCANLRSALSGIVSLLNQLPSWTRCASGNSRKLQHDMALGALFGALGETIAFGHGLGR